jgi:hypothetical protein
MKHALVTLLAAGLAVSVVHPSAAAQPVCMIERDAAGDGHLRGANAVTSPSLDILSLDVATGKNTVVAVLRLDTTTPDTITKPSLTYDVSFTINGSPGYGFTLTRSDRAGVLDTKSATARAHNATLRTLPTVVITPTTVTFTLPRAAFDDLKKPGAVITGITGQSAMTGGGADVAGGTSTYKDRTPSCLKPA